MRDSWSATALPGNVPVLRSQAVAFATTCQVVDPPIHELKLALSEALTNAVVHGYTGRDPGTMRVTIFVDGDHHEVHATVVDDGMGCVPRPDSPGLGLGLPLMSTLAGTLNVCTPASGVGTEVRMTFPLG